MERVWNALRRILPELLLILAGLLIAGGVWMIYPPRDPSQPACCWLPVWS